MNETIKVLLERRSIRAYEDKPVSREDLDTIVNCGLYAATAMGLQPWHLTVVTDRKVLDAISAANATAVLDDPNAPDTIKESARSGNFDSFRGAPVAILVSGENDKDMTIADCANATENMAIAAKALGLGSCYIASFKVCMSVPGGDEMKKLAGIPEGYIPYFALAIGHPAESPEPAPRKENTVTYIG